MVNKRDSNDPRQLSLFGEIPSSSNPSIATFPEFDQALNNLIKLSDLGAFIEINIQGFEKSYTLNLSESIIPKDFLKIPKNYSPITRKYATGLKWDINQKLLNTCAEILLGEHDFISFCKATAEVKNKICTKMSTIN